MLPSMLLSGFWLQDLSGADLAWIIGALAAGMVQIMGAVATMVVAVRTGRIQSTGEAAQKTGELTHDLVNSRTDAMMEQLERQRTALQDGGIAIPNDPSLPMNKK